MQGKNKFSKYFELIIYVFVVISTFKSKQKGTQLRMVGVGNKTGQAPHTGFLHSAEQSLTVTILQNSKSMTKKIQLLVFKLDWGYCV